MPELTIADIRKRVEGIECKDRRMYKTGICGVRVNEAMCDHCALRQALAMEREKVEGKIVQVDIPIDVVMFLKDLAMR